MIERLKIKYVFNEKSNPNEDMKQFFWDIRENFFRYWLTDVFFAKYSDRDWKTDPDSVAESFILNNKRKITEYMSFIQRKIFIHPSTLKEFKKYLVDVKL